MLYQIYANVVNHNCMSGASSIDNQEIGKDGIFLVQGYHCDTSG